MDAKGKAVLTLADGRSFDLPVFGGSQGPDVLDIRKLYAQTGMFTYDPGFMSTASCNSNITFIDGDKGELLYRGYPIEQLATQCDFMQVCHLLLYGDLPNPAQRLDFVSRVTNHTMVHEQMQFFLRGFRRDAHPMAVMTGLVGAMSSFYPDSMNLHDAQQRDISAPYAELFHHESATRGSDDTPENKLRLRKEAGYMRQRWQDKLENDPYYNPNLTLETQDFALAWPPRAHKPWVNG